MICTAHACPSHPLVIPEDSARAMGEMTIGIPVLLATASALLHQGRRGDAKTSKSRKRKVIRPVEGPLHLRRG
jgi:hypothetical protein